MEHYFLKVYCVLPESEYNKVKVSEHITDSSVVFFFSYAEFTIPKGAIFNYLKVENKQYQVHGELKFITQQFGFSLNEIPFGWKTICVINFSSKFDYLPTKSLEDGWYSFSNDIELGFYV